MKSRVRPQEGFSPDVLHLFDVVRGSVGFRFIDAGFFFRFIPMMDEVDRVGRVTDVPIAREMLIGRLCLYMNSTPGVDREYGAGVFRLAR